MAHQSLYRKYRPSTFDDVVGQQHIERTLRNAVAEGSVAHAYLFTGPRGTGKTTTARLLAKALLCERGPTAEPDGTCEQCAQVSAGTHPDVREIDAASNTGVDAVREEIIGRVQFAPQRGGYKVYIIDEVHMLSSAAFNALLKTLEEPPPHVVFILCTTHPHKVPETIHSRCQRFDFHRIGVDEIADRLRFIAESEGFSIEKGAFTLMARHADGGMRDAITTLEQLAAFTGGTVTVDDVEGMFGEVDSAQLFEIAGIVARRDVAGAFRWVAGTAESGTDLAELVRELTAHMRDLYVVAVVGDGEGIIDRTAEEMALISAQVAEFGGPDRIARALDLLGELASEMRWSSDPRLSLEIALTRMTRPHGEMTLAALAERVEALELGGAIPRVAVAPAPASAPVAAPPAEQPKPAPVAEPTEAVDATADAAPPTSVAEPAVAPVVEPGAKLDRATARRVWQAALVEVKKRKMSRAVGLSTVEVDVDTDGQTLVLEFPADQAFQVEFNEQAEGRELISASLAAVLGYAPPFRFQLGRGAVRPAEHAAEQAPAPAPTPTPAPTAEVESASGGDSPPDDDYYENAIGLSEPHETYAPPAPSGQGELHDLLVNQLGADIVAEHSHASDGEDE